jgi:hypothetical protein
MRITKTDLKQMIIEVLNETNGTQEEDPTKLGSAGASAAEFRASGIEGAKTAATDKEVTRVELGYITQVRDFLQKLAEETDLRKHKTAIQTLLKRLAKITQSGQTPQGEDK